MQCETFRIPSPEGVSLYVYRWLPDGPEPPRAVVQIAHGMAEHAGRYEYPAARLTHAGYAVYAHDHRGHGRTAAHLSALGQIGDDGFEGMVDDMRRVTERIHADFPGVPVFLLGHSMGSFLTLRYLERFTDGMAGAILSGSGGRPTPLIRLGIWLARREMRRWPHRGSVRLTRLTFRGFNRHGRPVRTPFDWLSRDPAVVDRFLQDPYCGALLPASFYYWFYRGLMATYHPRALDAVARVPVYMFSGDADPVGGRGMRGLRWLARALRRRGLQDVTLRLYPGGRHEMLNETNRDEVIDDLIAWLEQQCDRLPPLRTPT